MSSQEQAEWEAMYYASFHPQSSVSEGTDLYPSHQLDNTFTDVVDRIAAIQQGLDFSDFVDTGDFWASIEGPPPTPTTTYDPSIYGSEGIPSIPAFSSQAFPANQNVTSGLSSTNLPGIPTSSTSRGNMRHSFADSPFSFRGRPLVTKPSLDYEHYDDDGDVSCISDLPPPSQGRAEGPDAGMAPPPLSAFKPSKYSNASGKRRVSDAGISPPGTSVVSESSMRSSKRPNIGPTIDYGNKLYDIIWTIYLVAFYQDAFKRFSDDEIDVFIQQGKVQFQVEYPRIGMPSLGEHFHDKLRHRGGHRRSGDVTKGMEATIISTNSKGRKRLNYGFIGGSKLTGTEILANMNLAADLLDRGTMPFANVVEDGKIKSNLQNAVFEDFINRVMYGGTAEYMGIGLLLDHDEIPLFIYAYAVMIAYYCIEQFRNGEQQDKMQFSSAIYSQSAALVREKVAALAQDDTLTARRHTLAHAGQGLYSGQKVSHVTLTDFPFAL